MTDRPVKITFAAMCRSGVRGILVYAPITSAAILSRSAVTPGLMNVRLSDIEPRLICMASGKRGADVRPDFNWSGQGRPAA
jgi:hypothetical protein